MPKLHSRPVVLAVVIATTVVALSGTARGQLSHPTANTGATSGAPPVSLSALIDQAVALFPELRADVVEVRGATLTLSVGRSGGAIPGLVLDVSREGREIRNPRTAAILGRTEERLGRAVIAETYDGYSLATFEGTGAKPGDLAKTPAGKIRLTLLALNAKGIKENLAEAATNEIYEGLLRTGRFNVTLGDQIAVWMTQENVKPEDLLAGQRVAEAAKKFQAENLLVLFYRQVERKPFLDVRLFTTTRSAAALSTALFVPSSIKPVQPGRFSASDRLAATPERKPRSFLMRLLRGDLEAGRYSADNSIPLKEIGRFGFPMISMDVAVAPADKIPRLVLTDGDHIWTYKIVDKAMQPDWTFQARALGRVLSVQFASLTGDGTLQVVANRFDTRIGMNSMIVGVKDGKPVALVEQVDSLLLAVDEQGTGVKQTLWGSPYDERTFFTKGRADRLVLRDGALVTDGRAIVPDSFRNTGAAMSTIMGKDQPRALAFIDEFSRLRVVSGRDELWRSSSVVGGSPMKIEVERHVEVSGRSYFYRLEPTPLAIDLDGDGIEEIVIPQNQIDGMLGVVYHGPAGLRFQQVNSGFEGTISGIGAFKTEDGDAPTLIATVVRFSGITKSSGETQIIMTLGE